MRFTTSLPLLLLACATAAGAQGANATWHEFDYATSSRFGPDERLAVLLRADIDGKRCWLQLDTGAPHVVAWHQHAPAGTAPAPVSVTITVGDVRHTVSADAANLAPLASAPCMAGTVGNAFFEHGTLALDFAAGRYAFVPGAALRDILEAQPMLYFRSNGPGGHPLLPVTLADGRTGRMLVDTGAARFGIGATSAAHWRDLTGGLPLRENDNGGGNVRSFVANNAMDAAPLRCFETPYAGSVRMGDVPVTPGIVSYCEGKDFALEQPLLGLVGLRGLLRHQLTLDYVAQRWLLGAPGRPLPARAPE
ncbi:hypothetical protein IP92_00392 [Pseudoduganella flava]|uniref:Aspartyl protease n=1 Tax=Pseudoduganella flava TaxID=871742 RepID=A0A562Q3S1_9BURK|nr:hypothetical protein [Pseudoduganella flava]QGZ41452.1 hypothetical protein GO485_21895 [Pseudoduganella flava]TWI51407.1 hypothetical protein IP92_00392 [Pseudoduganella flava]